MFLCFVLNVTCFKLYVFMYDHQKSEPKWQKKWEELNLFHAEDKSDKEKYYILDMFPYPSGSGLHVGHPEGYTATDIFSRYKRMKGFNVLHPMGWDAFGLPAENYAIKTGIDPDKSTHDNIKTFKRQIQSLGFSYDWGREVTTCNPDYYKWTQWFFLFFYKNNLAYKKESPVNWCDSCKTVLANEQVVNGKCERCKNEVVQKKLAQWFFKITDFLEDQGKTTGLINGLDKIDWPESTKIMQKNWIGKKQGIDITYKIGKSDETIVCFTTRPDTNFGATFIVLAPEHPFVQKIISGEIASEQKEEVNKYVEKALGKTELERQGEGRTKTGTFTGFYAINDLNKTKMPIWVSDFVLAGFGTGAVVGVPGHDLRDFEFTQTFNIPVVRVVVAPDGDTSEITKPEQVQEAAGKMINSEFLDGLDIFEAKEKIMDHMEEKGWGKRVTTYSVRDWLISRQRYWGTPIPIVYDPEGNPHPVKEEHLPLELPTDIEDYKPKGTSPLGSSKKYVEQAEKLYGKGWRFEVDTMDTFVCSSWYFFRYCDPQNEKEFASKELMKKWLPIDTYVGGAEHTVLHLLYARFFTKALHKHGYINFDEPFQKLIHQGMILGEDGEKMSKSRGNVINPDEIIEKYGADTLRLYEMFIGPFEQVKPWNMKGVEGVYRFLQKVWRLSEKKIVKTEAPKNIQKLIHKTIKKVSKDIESFDFNTAISQMMICTNEFGKLEKLPQESLEKLLIILSPFAPHLAEEIWENLGHSESICLEAWPEYNKELAQDNEVEIAVQVNGKLRGTFTAVIGITKDDALTQAKKLENIQKFLKNKEITKEIFVPGKIVNLVVK